MIIFIDRDGTLIQEPESEQINSIEEVLFMPYVFESLQKLSRFGFEFVIVSNQDNLGKKENPLDVYNNINKFIIDNFNAQDIFIKSILTCPHNAEENCSCRKPKIGLLENLPFSFDKQSSFVVGDRNSDIEFAKNIGVTGYLIGNETNWRSIANQILLTRPLITKNRTTKETNITINVLAVGENAIIDTGLPFFDHMLEQVSKHSGLPMSINALGDLHIDEHHTVEDTAILLGEVIKELVGNKVGIKRYDFLLPMDESISYVAIDYCGRSNLVFDANFDRPMIGNFSTEMVEHFFKSFCDSAGITLHIKNDGKNTHHKIESIFKAFGKCLGNAVSVVSEELASTKGSL